MQDLNINNEVASISSSAMMVELSLSTWTGNKLDKRASNDVTTSNRASTSVARVNKSLLSGCEALKQIKTLVGEARNHVHYSLTLPWSDTGLRLLTNQMFFDYQTQMTAMEGRFYALVDTFIDDYDYEIQKAQYALGDLFDRDDYPSAESLRGKFKFSISYMPLPDAGDFRLDVGNEAIKELQDNYQAAFTEKLETAMRDVWDRVYKSLTAMSERLGYDDNGKKKVFRDSLVDNALDMVGLLKKCNVTNDTQMSALAQKLEDALAGITPDSLRDDEFLRNDTKKSIDKAIKELPNLGW